MRLRSARFLLVVMRCLVRARRFIIPRCNFLSRLLLSKLVLTKLFLSILLLLKLLLPLFELLLLDLLLPGLFLAWDVNIRFLDLRPLLPLLWRLVARHGLLRCRDLAIVLGRRRWLRLESLIVLVIRPLPCGSDPVGSRRPSRL